MNRILIVEDDKDANRFICTYLRNNNFDIATCFNGAEALDLLENEKFSMVITDIMMPKMDGFELAENIRLTDKEIPIIFMTAKDDKPSKIKGFELEIDDYVVKPIDLDILLGKIQAMLRRVKIESEKQITIGNFTINAEERIATIDKKEISLTLREFDLLFKLLSYPRKSFSRSALMEEFWGYDSSATSRTLDNYIVKLREKTAACDGFEILTVHGLGYKVMIK